MRAPKVRVLVVDDMAMVRELLSKGLSTDPAIEVVGAARDPYDARDKIVALLPDVMTLDVEMPRMDGVEFLTRLMPQHPMPVVMVSSLTERGKKTTMDALAAGAVDFVPKPGADVQRGLESMMEELREKVKAAAIANVSHWKNRPPRTPSPARAEALPESTDKVVAIGASTGGVQALQEVMAGLPRTMPGVVIVQHMPPGFTKIFAESLGRVCQMEVREARNGDRVLSGTALVAPGGAHMSVARSGGFYKVTVAPGPPVNGHCPSVEVLMRSVAKHAGANAVGVMLTGMGGDGSDGLRAMRDAGARTIAQDQASCVVFGMPKVAWEKGGVERLVPLGEISGAIISLLSKKS